MSEFQKLSITGLNGESGSSKKCIDIIKSAYRRARVSTALVPLNDEQIKIGVEKLQGIYLRMASGMFGEMEPYVVLSGDYEAKEFQKIFKVSPLSNISFPVTVVDEYTNKQRQPIDGAMIMIVSAQEGAPVIVVYNDILGTWDAITGLTKDSPAPLSMRYEDAIIDMLAEKVADENSLPVPDSVAKGSALGRLAMASHYSYGRRVVAHKFF